MGSACSSNNKVIVPVSLDAGIEPPTCSSLQNYQLDNFRIKKKLSFVSTPGFRIKTNTSRRIDSKETQTSGEFGSKLDTSRRARQLSPLRLSNKSVKNHSPRISTDKDINRNFPFPQLTYLSYNEELLKLSESKRETTSKPNSIKHQESTSSFHIPKYSKNEIIAVNCSKSNSRNNDDWVADVADILTHTPEKGNSYMKIEDTFWSGKRELIPDYSVMESIDEYVLRVPRNTTNTKQLISTLISHCRNDVEKARAVNRWIAHHITYDGSLAAMTRPQTVEEILTSGLAICEGFSTLLSHLCSLCRIECRVIRGQSKGASYFPGHFDSTNLRLDMNNPGHAWNALKIESKWLLCDVTWAAAAAGSKDKSDCNSWTEEWFFSDPEYFALTHIPLENDRILIENQHSSNTAIRDANMWAEQPLLSPLAGVYGVYPISHPNSVIQIDSGDLVIEYSCVKALEQFVEVKQVFKRGIRKTSAEIKDCVTLVTLKDRTYILLRLQKPGTYDIEVYAFIQNGHLALRTRLLAYSIQNNGKSINSPFLRRDVGNFGVKPRFLNSGFELLYPEIAVIESTKGVAVVQIKLPSPCIIPNMVRLSYTSQTGITGKCHECVLSSQHDDIATFYAQCPRVGEYRLDVYFKHENVELGFYASLSVLIICKEPIQNVHKSDLHTLFGWNEQSRDMGLALQNHCSLLRTKTHQMTLQIKHKVGIQIDVELKSFSDQVELEYSDIELTKDKNISNLNIKLPEHGFYILLIYAGSLQGKVLTCVGRFGIDFGALKL